MSRTRGARLVAVMGALALSAGCGDGAMTGADHASHSSGAAATGDPSSGPTEDAAGTAFDGDLATLVTTEVPDEFGPSSMPEPINQTQAFDLDFYLANLTGNADSDREALTSAGFVDGYHLHLQAQDDYTWIDLLLFRTEDAEGATRLLDKDRADWAASAPDAVPVAVPREGVEASSSTQTRANGATIQVHHGSFAMGNLMVLISVGSQSERINVSIYVADMAVKEYDLIEAALTQN